MRDAGRPSPEGAPAPPSCLPVPLRPRRPGAAWPLCHSRPRFGKSEPEGRLTARKARRAADAAPGRRSRQRGPGRPLCSPGLWALRLPAGADGGLTTCVCHAHGSRGARPRARGLSPRGAWPVSVAGGPVTGIGRSTEPRLLEAGAPLSGAHTAHAHAAQAGDPEPPGEPRRGHGPRPAAIWPPEAPAQDAGQRDCLRPHSTRGLREGRPRPLSEAKG